MSVLGSTTTIPGVALLERAMGYTLGGLQLVTPDLMTKPTPCAGWDLRALLLHMNDSLHTLHEAIAVGHLALDPSGDRPGEPAAYYGDPAIDPVTTLRNRACQMIGAWAGAPDGGVSIAIADRPLPSDIVAAAGAVEVAVHGWDVARACGQPRAIPAELARELLELSRVLVDEAGRDTAFGIPVDVPAEASPSDRIAAFLGRRP
jgi:uncharacterized protein (TIGR03086 family)